MTTKTGGPAFPVADFDMQTFQPKNIEEHKRLLSGMSLRDYFAAKALQGYLASCASDFEPVEFATAIARDAYFLADAMLAARSEGEPHD